MFNSYFNPPLKEEFKQLLSYPITSKRIALRGVAGSSFALLASDIVSSAKEHQVFLFPDREEALYFYHDLEKLLNEGALPLNEKKLHYFPSSYHRGYKHEEFDNSNVKLRAEIIYKISSNNCPYIIVSYPEAIIEKITSKEFIRKNTFVLKKGEILPFDIFLDFLYSYQYRQEEFVFEPGQFAWRGGIFDIFSYAEEYPFRIEMDGERIGSIRQFNTSDQLSIAEVEQLELIPMLSSTEFMEKRISFFEFLGNNTRFWIKSYDDIVKQIENFQLNWENEHENNDNYEPIYQDYSTNFISSTDFKRHSLSYELVEVETDSLKNYEKIFDFKIQPQHHFAKSFELLFLEWIDNYEKGIQTLFLSDNENQIKRIETIIRDHLIIYNRENFTEYSVENLYTPLQFILYEGFRDEAGKLFLYTDHQILERYYRFDIKSRFKKNEAYTLKELYDLRPGDYVVHINHGIGIYAGLQKMEVNGKEQEVIKLLYKDGDELYISIHSLHKISKYVGKEGTPPTIYRLGSGTWQKVKARAKKRVKELAIDLIKLYAERKSKKGFAFSPDNYLQTELEASFIYEDTPDQEKSLEEIKKDMEADYPMDRLICGDVGFGKTEVAIRSAFKAVCDSKQVAVLVPTTVLALQHFNTFSERLEKMPCNVDYINRFKTKKQIQETLAKVESGEIDILIGTHRLLSKDVNFKDLGLLIIDEEQKFGVAAKEKLREKKTTVDTLTMSATPIPRTLQFSLMGARDISVITTPPPNRYPIQTEIHLFNEELIRSAVSYEIGRGGQVFIVHNKIQTIEEIANIVQRLVPEARVAVGHGQMDGNKLEKIMFDFIRGNFDVLVATTIVESGLDITNANTMIINDAQNFALNILHQLRGRVGRNNKKAFCYLLVHSFDILNDNAKKRLKAIEEFSDIGSGFQIAMRDLDIRGAGDILGAEQSGFIHEIGFDTYQKILSEALAELREEDATSHEMAENRSIFYPECNIETDLKALLPTEYVASTNERMNLYKELNYIKSDEALANFRKKLIDLFGPIPKETEELLQLIPLKRLAQSLYFEKIVLKKGVFTGYFSAKSDSSFYHSPLFESILTFLQKNHPQVQMKEHNKKLTLIIKNIPTIKAAIHWLERIVNEQNKSVN